MKAMENTTEWEEKIRKGLKSYFTSLLHYHYDINYGNEDGGESGEGDFEKQDKYLQDKFIAELLSAKDAEIERAIEEVIRDLYTETQSIRDANNLTREEKFDQESGILKGIAKLKFKYLNSEKKE